MYLYYLLLFRTYVHTLYLCKYVYVTPEMPRAFSVSEELLHSSWKGLANQCVSVVRLLIERQALGK